MTRHITWLGSLALVAAIVGCSSEAPTETSTTSPHASAEGAKYLLSTAPDGAQDVIPVREAAADDEEVVVIGRIGGSQNPWIEGRAAFSIVDRSLPACTDIPGDTCPTPWDYCCATDRLPAATTLVKLVDEQGELVATDARELLGLGELQTVVIKGKTQRDDAGNVTILASSLYVDPTNPGHASSDHAGHDHDGHDHAGHDHDDHDHDHHDHPEAKPDAAVEPDQPAAAADEKGDS